MNYLAKLASAIAVLSLASAPALAVAPLNSSPLVISLDQPNYTLHENIFLTVEGTPGQVGFLLFDSDSTPTQPLGLNLDIGFSGLFAYEFITIPDSGVLTFPCDVTCDLQAMLAARPPVIIQGVSLGPRNELCASNSIVLHVDKLHGNCGDCGPCSGGVSSLTMHYRGDSPGYVEVVELGKHGQIETTYFSGMLAPYEIFTANGADAVQTPAPVYNPSPYGDSCNKGYGKKCGKKSHKKCKKGHSKKSDKDCDKGHGKHGKKCKKSGKKCKKSYGKKSYGKKGHGKKCKPDPCPKFSKNLTIMIDGQVHTTLHTSCSKPIGPDLAFGDFFIVEATSCAGPICAPTPNDGDDCDAGKPIALELRYTGEDCSASNNQQDADKATCEGDPADAAMVHVRAFGKHGEVYVDAFVALGETFLLEAAAAGSDKLDNNMIVQIWGPHGALLQTVTFHTSCSQPIGIGDVYGALEITGYVPKP